jgi:hypothetical protein
MASAAWLRERGAEVRFATYDRRMATACVAMGMQLAEA